MPTKRQQAANKRPMSTEQELDALVKSRINRVQKSVVVAPSDPTGGAKLPKSQEDAAKRKGRGKEQYMAIFDRDDAESNEQLDDWLDDTQETTDSPDDFVEDARDDDEPGDGTGYEDGDDVYDPYTDDDADDIEELELPDDDEQYITVKKHKRRRKVSKAVDDDDDFADTEDDDDVGEDEDDDDEDEKDEKEEKRREKESRRKKEVRKALGSDAMKYVDGSDLIKSLTEAVWDIKDELREEMQAMSKALRLEVRELRAENRKLKQQISTRVANGNKAVVKSLTDATLQIAGYEMPQEAAQPQRRQTSEPMRKGFGQPTRTSKPAIGAPLLDLEKAFDAIEEEIQKGLGTPNEDPTLVRAITILESGGAGAVVDLPDSAINVLKKANLLR